MIKNNIIKLEEIKGLLLGLSHELYTNPNDLIGKATVGQHIRHILEFYICLEKGVQSGVVCYDNRERDERIEIDSEYSIHIIDPLIQFIKNQVLDKSIILKANYSIDSNDEQDISSSLYRELAYALDHTVHHLAIIKIALLKDYPLNENFGVAPSTIRNRNKICYENS